MNRSPSFLPYGRQFIGKEDVEAVRRVLESDFLTTGPMVETFERAFAEKLGAPFAVACSSGTAALHLAVRALALPSGAACVVPAVTFAATASVVLHCGGRLLLADVDPATGLMTPAHLEAAIERAGNRPVAAVLPVHYAGQPAAMAELRAIAQRHEAWLVEDACHALGSRFRDGQGEVIVGDGSRSDLACFSFHPVKMIACGEGGMVTTADPHLADRVRRLRNHGIVRDPARFVQPEAALDSRGSPRPWYYEVQEPGFNYRLSDIHAALGWSQLRRLEFFVARRRRLVESYDRLLAPFAPHLLPLGRVAGAEPGWHLYVVRIDFEGLGIDRAAVVHRLRERGIGSQVHYIPLHLQPCFRAYDPDLRLPGAEAFYARCLSLPLFVGMTEEDVERVVGELAHVLGLVR